MIDTTASQASIKATNVDIIPNINISKPCDTSVELLFKCLDIFINFTVLQIDQEKSSGNAETNSTRLMLRLFLLWHSC